MICEKGAMHKENLASPKTRIRRPLFHATTVKSANNDMDTGAINISEEDDSAGLYE
jgi:hypothetical protein